MKRARTSTEWILQTVRELSRGHEKIIDDIERGAINLPLVRRELRIRKNPPQFENHFILDFGPVPDDSRKQRRTKRGL